jgi:long-subunit fatty acid transport protein
MTTKILFWSRCMKSKLFSTITILLALNIGTFAGDIQSKRGTTAAPFLEFSVGSRATAMGGAFAAISNDATAMYWNPSGLDRFSENEVNFNYTKWIAGMDFIYAGAVVHTGGAGSFGLSVTSLSTPEMEFRTVEEPEGLGTKFDAADVALGLSYGISLTDRFSFGTSFKYIQRRIWHMSADAIAMDFGVLYTLPWDRLQLGMSISNMGSKLQMTGVDAMLLTDIDPTKDGNNTSVISELHTKEWSLPMILRFGVAYHVIKSDMNNLVIAADYVHPNDNFESMNAGLEYTFSEFLMLRAGYQSLFVKDSEEGLTLGVGVKHSGIGVDYSYAKMKNFGSVQQFSAKIAF